MKKIIVMLAFCLLGVALFAQTDDVLSLQDAIALHEDDGTKTYSGDSVIEIIKELVSEGINAYCTYGYTPLMYASQYGYIEIAKSLIAEGARVNQEASDSSTVLMRAAVGGYTEVVKILIEAGANVNVSMGHRAYSRNSALLTAAQGGHTEVVKILIEAGANLNANLGEQNHSGDTVLMGAAWNGHTETVTYLIEVGATIRGALMVAAEEGETEVVKLLIEAGANLDTQDHPRRDVESGELLYSGGNTALILATQEEHTETVKILIEAGADLDLKNNDGNTALDEAFDKGYTEIVHILTETQGFYTIKGTGHNYYEIPYAGEASVLTEIVGDEKNTIIEKYKFPATENNFLDDGSSITGILDSVYREDIPNESGETVLIVYRLMYKLSVYRGSSGMTKLSFIEGERTERQSYGQALYIVNSDETNAKLFSRDIYFGNSDLSGADSLGVIGNNAYFKVIDDAVISVMYTLVANFRREDYYQGHSAIIYRNNIEDIQNKTELCKVEVPFPLIDKNNPYRYTIQNAFDGNPATSFVEDTEDDLMTIQFDFTKDHTFTDIALINGYAQTESIYQFNNRVKSINFLETTHSYTLDGNTLTHQEFTFEDSITQSSAIIDVTEIYEGTKYSDTCLAELDIKTNEGWLFGLE